MTQDTRLTAVRPRSLIGELLGRIRELAVKALAATCWSWLTLLVRSLDEPLPEVQAALALEFGTLRESEADEYVAAVPDNPERIRRRLRAGELCCTARHEGRLVGVIWSDAEGSPYVQHLHGRLRLAEDEVLITSLYTADDVRRAGIAASLGRAQHERLRASGYRRAVTLVLASNRAGFGPTRRLGYHREGIVLGVGLGPWRRVFVVGTGLNRPWRSAPGRRRR
jgi:GNAT superfamily N-acetyltransferase